MRARVYYADGERFDVPEDGSWADAPAWGVIAVGVPHPETGWSLWHGDQHDYYAAVDGECLGIDRIGLVDLGVRQGWLKVGRVVPDAEYRAIIARAMSENERSAVLPNKYSPR